MKGTDCVPLRNVPARLFSTTGAKEEDLHLGKLEIANKIRRGSHSVLVGIPVLEHIQAGRMGRCHRMQDKVGN